MSKHVWIKNEITIEFKNGAMTYYDEYKKAKGMEDVMYFYYTVVIKQKIDGKIKKLSFNVSDFPKVQELGNYIDYLIKFDIKKDGYLLENFQRPFKTAEGEDKLFYRRIYYHQIELDDMFYNEYFLRLERYDYEVKQTQDETHKENTQYKMTIGEIPYGANSECGEAMFFNYLLEEDLLNLKEVANKFVDANIRKENRGVLKRKKSEGIED